MNSLNKPMSAPIMQHANQKIHHTFVQIAPDQDSDGQFVVINTTETHPTTLPQTAHLIGIEGGNMDQCRSALINARFEVGIVTDLPSEVAKKCGITDHRGVRFLTYKHVRTNS